jgi:NADPH-dependent F420 reductase
LGLTIKNIPSIRDDAMKIGLIGGTGPMGTGLAIRWAKTHAVYIGSRSREKGLKQAKVLNDTARHVYDVDMLGSIDGGLNTVAVKNSRVIVITLPPYATFSSLLKLQRYFTTKQIVISTIVPMVKRKGLFYYTSLQKNTPPKVTSAAEVISEVVHPLPVITAFQTVPAACLNNIDSIPNLDVFIAGDDEPALDTVAKLIQDIPNLKPLKVGPLTNSIWVEALTPLLLNASILNGLKNPSFQVIPWMP